MEGDMEEDGLLDAEGDKDGDLEADGDKEELGLLEEEGLKLGELLGWSSRRIPSPLSRRILPKSVSVSFIR